ncbi:MAG: lipopolysaccharide assembly LapA domain-containing protein [Acidimicrobiia bacterium]
MAPAHDNDVTVEYRGTGFYVSLAIIFLAAITLLILAVQNTGEVTIRFLGLEFALPLFAIILGTALIALLLDELIGLVWRRQRRTRLEERAELRRLRAGHKGQEGPATMEDKSSDGPEKPSAEPDLSTPYPPSTN